MFNLRSVIPNKIRNCTGKTVLYFQSPVVFLTKYFSLLIFNQFLINEYLNECSEKFFHMNNKGYPCHKITEEADAPDDTLIEQKTL